MHVAENTMVAHHILLNLPSYSMVLQELATMRLLWAFDFHPAIDQVTGQPIKPNLEDYTSVRSHSYHLISAFNRHCSYQDITLAPRPFRCRIVPRSPQRAHVVRRSFVDATNTLRLFEDGLTDNEKEELHGLRKQQEVSFE